MRKLALAAALIGVCAPAIALAQETERRTYVHVSGGAAAETDYSYDLGGIEVTSELEGGYTFAGAYGTSFGQNWRGEFGLSYRSHSSGQTDIAGFVSPDEPEFSVLSLDLNLYYDFPTGGPFRPYVGGTAGVAQVDVRDAVLDDSGEALKLRGVVGASLSLGERVALFAEGGYERVGKLEIEGTVGSTSVTDEFSVNGAVFGAGLRLKL